MRMADDVFRVVTGGAYGMSDKKWFADHLPDDGSAQIHDQTNAWTTLGLWGPRARDILQSVTSDDVSHEGMPFARCKQIEVGPVEVLASRISYVGDLGWELYVPFEQGARLWDIVAEAGAPHGIIPAGHRRVRDHRPPREVLPRVRRRARGRLQRGRGRHGLGQGQGRGLHRQGGAPAPPRRGAGRDHVHPDRRRPHVEVRRQALHARPRADPHPRGRTDHRPQRPPLVRDERRARDLRSGSTS